MSEAFWIWTGGGEREGWSAVPDSEKPEDGALAEELHICGEAVWGGDVCQESKPLRTATVRVTRVLMTPEQQRRHHGFWETLITPGEYSDEDLAVLRRDMEGITTFSSATKAYAETRLALELLFAIRKFDKASADLIKTTNRLTGRIIILTLVMVAVGILGAFAGGWPYLIWWLTHGLHFR